MTSEERMKEIERIDKILKKIHFAGNAFMSHKDAYKLWETFPKNEDNLPDRDMVVKSPFGGDFVNKCNGEFICSELQMYKFDRYVKEENRKAAEFVLHPFWIATFVCR